jgi:glyoxylase-like metal-dependent hydrolase (beta-lactamase superfamily II)
VRIHHLNCGTCCPLGGRLFDGTSDSLSARLVCHCLLIESNDGLILVDTGFGTRDVARPHERLSDFFITLNRPRLRHEETAIAQVRRLGFDPADVRHIVVSHLDFDHAGGIEDFPCAAIHLLETELDAAGDHRGGMMGTKRYRPQQWDQVTDWRRYQSGQGEDWFGFKAVRDLEGLPPEILLVPLLGHTWGHAGVGIEEDDGKWLFYASDAYFFRGEIGSEEYRCPPGMRGYQAMMEVDRAARLANQDRLRHLSLEHEGDIRIFCAHDAVEFDILSGTGELAA